MFERKLFTIQTIRDANRPVFIRAVNAKDAIRAFTGMVGLVAFEFTEKEDGCGATYTDFRIGTGEMLYCYESQPQEIEDLTSAA